MEDEAPNNNMKFYSESAFHLLGNLIKVRITTNSGAPFTSYFEVIFL